MVEKTLAGNAMLAGDPGGRGMTVSEQWDVTLEQILREADVMTEKREFKR